MRGRATAHSSFVIAKPPLSRPHDIQNRVGYDSPRGTAPARVARVSEPVQSRVLRRAARVVGGYGPLQQQLNASREDMISWIRGAAVPPVATFAQLVELLLDAGELGRSPPV